MSGNLQFPRLSYDLMGQSHTQTHMHVHNVLPPIKSAKKKSISPFLNSVVLNILEARDLLEIWKSSGSFPQKMYKNLYFQVLHYLIPILKSHFYAANATQRHVWLPVFSPLPHFSRRKVKCKIILAISDRHLEIYEII